MSALEQEQTPVEWLCSKCSLPLRPRQIMVAYLGHAYPVDLMCCPQCGLVFVPEDLALGRMAEVEKALEDK